MQQQSTRWRTRHRRVLLVVWLHIPAILGMETAIDERHGLEAPWVLLLSMVVFLVVAMKGGESYAARIVRSCGAALALISQSLILVHLLDGVSGPHLHIMISLSVVSFYHLWRPLVLAGGLAIIHHWLVGYNHPELIFAGSAHPLASLGLHTVFISLFVFFAILHWRSISQLVGQVETVTDSLEATTHVAQFEHERAIRAEEVQDEFLGAMVHQLKTPLTIIRGYADVALLCLEMEDSDQLRASLESVICGTDKMNETIEHDLSLVRNEAEGWRSDVQLVENIVERVEEIVEDLRVKFIGLEVWKSNMTTPTVQVDSRILKIILEHLVENAHTHGAKDRPITISIDEHRRSVEIAISSWGSQDKDRLDESCFGRGHRGKGSVGSGLGLWIVKNHARSMGGDVRFHQEDHDEGERYTTFSLDLLKVPTATRREENEDALNPAG